MTELASGQLRLLLLASWALCRVAPKKEPKGRGAPSSGRWRAWITTSSARRYTCSSIQQNRMGLYLRAGSFPFVVMDVYEPYFLCPNATSN